MTPETAPEPLIRVAALADLSRRPTPPVLDGRLRANYPADLERRGVEGEAMVRLTLSKSGRVEHAQTISQTDPGFAEACRKTLLDTVWSPPLDRDGEPVRTTLSYRCRFRVAL